MTSVAHNHLPSYLVRQQSILLSRCYRILRCFYIARNQRIAIILSSVIFFNQPALIYYTCRLMKEDEAFSISAEKKKSHSRAIDNKATTARNESHLWGPGLTNGADRK